METVTKSMTAGEYEAEVARLAESDVVKAMEDSLPPALNLEEMVQPGPAGEVSPEFLEASNDLYDRLTQNADAVGRPVAAVPQAMLRVRQAKRAELDRLVDRMYI